jgi:integrase
MEAFNKFLADSASGRRLQHSGKRIRSGTVKQYRYAGILLKEFESMYEKPLKIFLLHRSSVSVIQKEKAYWERFYRNFASFLYHQKGYLDKYAGSVFRVIKTCFNWLAKEKMLPVGEFHRRFRVPADSFTPVVLSPSQLRFLISDKKFESTLPGSLQRTKDIFVFGCIIGLRHQDLMQLKKNHIQHGPEGASIVLHTQKTTAEVKIPLPDYALDIIEKYRIRAGRYILPRIAGCNLNYQIKSLIKKAGWDHFLPKIRHRRGVPVEVKTKQGDTYRFYDHITIHTMRRTAITTYCFWCG